MLLGVKTRRARPCKHGVDGFFDNLKGDKLCVYTHLPNLKGDSRFCHMKWWPASTSESVWYVDLRNPGHLSSLLQWLGKPDAITLAHFFYASFSCCDTWSVLSWYPAVRLWLEWTRHLTSLVCVFMVPWLILSSFNSTLMTLPRGSSNVFSDMMDGKHFSQWQSLRATVSGVILWAYIDGLQASRDKCNDMTENLGAWICFWICPQIWLRISWIVCFRSFDVFGVLDLPWMPQTVLRIQINHSRW